MSYEDRSKYGRVTEEFCIETESILLSVFLSTSLPLSPSLSLPPSLPPLPSLYFCLINHDSCQSINYHFDQSAASLSVVSVLTAMAHAL